eukprot:TRINITY_DN3039_c0_g1_i6.p2 TRINITY_DN3039_c0_g1~~TRINITY_DN3039_c0_g1_i6.p2  ORF type:complete len:221 (+),score=-26.67 TRINITY_DN3039_c0_g1_i6:28-663(+)
MNNAITRSLPQIRNPTYVASSQPNVTSSQPNKSTLSQLANNSNLYNTTLLCIPTKLNQQLILAIFYPSLNSNHSKPSTNLLPLQQLIIFSSNFVIKCQILYLKCFYKIYNMHKIKSAKNKLVFLPVYYTQKNKKYKIRSVVIYVKNYLIYKIFPTNQFVIIRIPFINQYKNNTLSYKCKYIPLYIYSLIYIIFLSYFLQLISVFVQSLQIC